MLVAHSTSTSRLAWLLTFSAACAGGAVSTLAVEAPFQIFPERIEMHDQRPAYFVVQSINSRGLVGRQLTDSVKISVLDSSVARVENGRVIAVGDGETELKVQSEDGRYSTQIPVAVSGAGLATQWKFDAHVQSVLARHGCNSGACHGALAGKGGFRLSLRGYDSAADYYSITRHDRGRRIAPADPGRSLLLTKPTTAIAHKGGKRFENESLAYRILADWISSGSPPPSETDPELVSVEVLPRAMTLAPRDVQQLVVLAHYADGRVEDVTDWAKFSSASEAIAGVDERGSVTVVGNGKGAVVVWFASRIAVASVVVPYAEQQAETAYRDFHATNLIDDILLEEWKALGLAPSPACTDATFVRRAFIDATGTIPDAQRVRDFLANPNPQRDEQLVEELLSSEVYVDYWAYQWSDLLLVNGTLLRPDAVAAFYRWIREKVQSNAPWDELAREIVLAKGESLEQGATNFYAIHQTPESLTENTCQAFLGLSIGCAKCHNHPLEKWTNDQYYGMANLFARVRAKGWGGDSRNGDGKRTLVTLDRGDLIQPSRGMPQPPTPLDAKPLDIDDPSDRRIALAQWLTDRENQYFSRAIVNRVWANFFGTGLVSPVDDLRQSNPACSQRLLDELAAYLCEHDYDLKSLMRLIMNSATYRRSSQAIAGNAEDERFYCRYYPRRLMAEVLHDAVAAVTKVPSSFTEIEFVGADKKPTDFYEKGTTSLQLYDSAVANYFLKTFGRHQRRITCVCERSDQPTVVQALHLNNGDTINEKLSHADCVISEWLQSTLTLEEIVEEAYWRTLSRPPSMAERDRMIDLLREAEQASVDRRESVEDLMWSLMTSDEFLFSH
ncbi:MAG: DUF1553 domain-containing protein [Planctomycetales bacterium]|nr:DUF1553 domain-containing protein [Planctomycetales bacterium]